MPQSSWLFQIDIYRLFFRDFYTHFWIWPVHWRNYRSFWCLHHHSPSSNCSEQFQQLLQDQIVAQRSRHQETRQAHSHQQFNQRVCSYRCCSVIPFRPSSLVCSSPRHLCLTCLLDLLILRVPALRAFWDLEKTVLHEIHVSGTVLWSPTISNSPTCMYISKNLRQWKPCQ